MRASEIMTADPFIVVPSDSVRRAADIMRELNIGAVPVVDSAARQVLRGIITDRDIVTRCTSEGHLPFCLVGDHMTRQPLQTVGPDDDVADVILLMQRAGVRRIPVVTGDDELLGIIAQADLATTLGPDHPREIEALLEQISAAPAQAKWK